MVEYYGYVVFNWFAGFDRSPIIYLGPFDWTGSAFIRNNVAPLTFQGDTL